MNETNNLPQRLRAHRIALGLTQEAAARQTGVAVATWNRWERAKHPPLALYRQMLERWLSQPATTETKPQ